MHEYAPLAITLVAIFAGILLNRSDLKGMEAKLEAVRLELKTEIAGLRSQVTERLSVIEGDLRSFYQITGELKGRIDTV